MSQIRNILDPVPEDLDWELLPEDIVKLPPREKQRYFSLHYSTEECWQDFYRDDLKDINPKPLPNQVRISVDYGLGDYNIGNGELFIFPPASSREKGSIKFNEFHPLDDWGGRKLLGEKGLGTLAHISTLIALVEDSLVGPDYEFSIAGWRKYPADEFLEKTGADQYQDTLQDHIEAFIQYTNRKGFEFKMPRQNRVPYEGRARASRFAIPIATRS